MLVAQISTVRRVAGAFVLLLGACATGTSAPASSTTPPDTAATSTTSLLGEPTTSSTAAASSVATTTTEPSTVEMVPNVQYGPDDSRNVLDIYLPLAVEGPYPTVMAIHGGGFHSGRKIDLQAMGRYYAERGVAFVSIEYRLAPFDIYPAQVADSLCAFAWMYAHHGDYGFDPQRLVVTGGSAGGYLAAMVATVDDPAAYLGECPHEWAADTRVAAAVIHYGLFDFLDLEDYPPSTIRTLEAMWGAESADVPLTQLIEMSPIEQIDGSESPILLVHGTADTIIPSVMSERFSEALRDAGVEVELVLIQGAAHAYERLSPQDEPLATALEAADAFLARVLGS